MPQSRVIVLTIEVIDSFTAPLRALRDRLGFGNDDALPPAPVELAAASTPEPQRRLWPEDPALDELLANEPTETQARLARGFRWSDLTDEIHAEREGTG